MRWVVLALVGCTSASDSTKINDLACTRTSDTELVATAELDATLETNETLIVEVTFEAAGTKTASATEQWTCGAWTSYAAIGCRRTPGQPSSAHLTMTHDEKLAQGVLPNPLQVSIGGKLLGEAITATATTTCQ